MNSKCSPDGERLGDTSRKLITVKERNFMHDTRIGLKQIRFEDMACNKLKYNCI
jgi:hypothetical protein